MNVEQLKRPKDVNCCEDFISLKSDNSPSESDKWSILHNGTNISLHAPNGKGWVEIPKADFDAIVDWYTRPQGAKEEA